MGVAVAVGVAVGWGVGVGVSDAADDEDDSCMDGPEVGGNVLCEEDSAGAGFFLLFVYTMYTIPAANRTIAVQSARIMICCFFMENTSCFIPNIKPF